jgi:iron complex outermembrane recepter protein
MKRISFFLCIAISTFVAAQTDTTELIPVEVRAVRAAETAPLTRTDVNKTEIRKRNTGQDLPFILNYTPSVVVNSDAGNGVGYTGLRIRGTDATRINVTLNGIPFNDAESQGTFFVDLPDFTSSVNSIQIQRGVGTSSNGPGAFGASIVMSTNEINKQAYAEVNNSYGSFNTWKNTIKLGSGLLSDHFTIDARLSRVSSDGYIDRAESELGSFYFSTAYLANKTNLRFNAFSGKEKTYQAWYGVSEADLRNNRTINYAGMEKPGDPYENETDNYQQDHYQFFFDQKLSGHLSFNTALFLVNGKGYYEQYKANESYSRYGMPDRIYNGQIIPESDVIRRLWLDNNYYGNVFSLQHRKGGQELIVGGAITQYDGRHFGEIIWAENGMNGDSHTWYRLPAEKKDFSLYAKSLFNLTGALKLFTDLQWRKVDYQIDGFRDNSTVVMDNDYNFLNPKIGLTYNWKNLKAYASYSQGNKEPNRDDFETDVDDIPQPEKLHDWEAGVEHNKTGLHLAANLYYMKYRDQLVLTGKLNDVGAYTRTNIDESYRVGVEIEASSQIAKFLRLGGNLTVSRNRLKDFTEYIDNYDFGGQKVNVYEESPISFSPSLIGTGMVSVKHVQPLELELIGKYVSKQYLDNTGNEERALDGYFLQDIRAAYTIQKNWISNATLFVNVFNLFDKKYEPNGYTFSYIYSGVMTTENYYYPMAGRNFMVGLNISF